MKKSKGPWLVDITTLNAIESNAHPESVKDPWGRELAGLFADFYAYASNPQFILPNPASRAAGPKAPVVPAIVSVIQKRESKFQPMEYSTSTRLALREEFLEEALQNFLTWCSLNPTRLRHWLALHCERWIAGGHAARVPDRYVYHFDTDFANKLFERNANKLNFTIDDLAYAFDVALRYGFYGEMAANGTYFSHPLREQQQLPTMSVKFAEAPPVALTFAPSVARLATSLTLDQYTSLIHEIREVVEAKKLRNIMPGAIENNQIREIAADLQLPVRLKGWAKATGLSAAFLGGIAAIPTIAVGATVGAAIVGIGSIFWDGSIPRSVSNTTWLRWALHWQLEDPKIK